MTVSKGAAWGARGPRPSGTLEVGDDRGARRAVERARQAGEAIPPLRLSSGDLWRTVGSPAPGSAEDAWLFPADLGVADLDGEERCFVAHLVARRSWWRGRVVGVMNAQFVGTWDVAPRSHPNDGRLDVVDVAPSLSGTDRWRARHGSRVAPTCPIRPSRSARRRPGRPPSTSPRRCGSTGSGWARSVALSVRVEPDALVLVV